MKTLLLKINQQFFIITFIFFCVLFLIELLQNGFVVNFFNINYIFIPLIVSYLIGVLFQDEGVKSHIEMLVKKYGLLFLCVVLLIFLLSGGLLADSFVYIALLIVLFTHIFFIKLVY